MAARKKKAKKITLSELSFMLERFVNSVANIEEKVASSTALTHAPLPSRAVDGINRRLDTEFDATHRPELPDRVSDLEIELFGALKAPKAT